MQSQPTSSSTSASQKEADDVFAKRDLFGCALKIAIPKLWRDVSAVRQVPDHQEVFQDFQEETTELKDKSIYYEGTGGCIVIEILERQNDVSDEDAMVFFFNDLAHVNGDEAGQLKSNIANRRVCPQGKKKDDDYTVNKILIRPLLLQLSTATSLTSIKNEI